MANERPDPGEFLDMAQRMLRELFGGSLGGSSGGSSGEEEPWSEATRRGHETFSREGHREPSPARQRENLTFALATRAVEALEDLALNVAAIRQRLERTAAPPAETPPAETPSPEAPSPEAPSPPPSVEQPPGNPDPGAF